MKRLTVGELREALAVLGDGELVPYVPGMPAKPRLSDPKPWVPKFGAPGSEFAVDGVRFQVWSDAPAPRTGYIGVWGVPIEPTDQGYAALIDLRKDGPGRSIRKWVGAKAA